MSKSGPVTRSQASALLAQTDSDIPDHTENASGALPVDHALPSSAVMGSDESGVQIPTDPGFVVSTGGTKLDPGCPLSDLLPAEKSVPVAVEDELAHLRGLVTGLMSSVAPTGPAVGQRDSSATSNYPQTDERGSHSVPSPTGTGPLGAMISHKHTFDGSVSWSAYHAQFEIIARHSRWSEAEKATNLAASLSGPALELLGHMDPERRFQYASLVDTLARRFGCSHREHLYRSELRRRVRGSGEALPKLADEIERLAFLAYPSAPADYRAVMTCDHFIDALADSELQIAVRQSRPCSLSDALASALEIESIRRANNPSDRTPTTGLPASGVATGGKWGNLPPNLRSGTP